MKSDVISIRLASDLAQQIKQSAAAKGMSVNAYVQSILAAFPHMEASTKPEPAIKGPSDRVPPQGAEQLSRGFKPTARALLNQYKAETELPPVYREIHAQGIIPLSWFVARHQFTIERIDEYDEFLSVDPLNNEPCWEFVEE